MKTAFKLRGIVKKIQEEVEKYDAVRQDALKRLGMKDDNGELILSEGQVQFDQEGMRTFMKELAELVAVEVTVDTISIDSLSEAVSLSAEDLLLLDGLIV